MGGREGGRETLVKETSASPLTVPRMGGCRENEGLSCCCACYQDKVQVLVLNC